MTIKIPVVTEYNGQGLRQARNEARQTDADLKRQLAERRRLLSLSAKLERDITKEQRDQERALRQQIAQRNRLNALSRRLDREQAAEAQSRRDRVMTGIGTGLAVAGTLAVGAVELAQQADQAQATERSFARLSGSAEAYQANLVAMERATRGLVSEQEQQAIANRLLGMNLVENAQQLEQLVGGARRLGKEFRGMGAAEAADEFALLLSNMSYERLDQFGLSSGKVRQRVNELKESGMAAEDAFRTAVFEEMGKTLSRLGDESETTSDKIAALGGKWSDLEVALGKFSSAALSTSGAFDFIESGLEGWTTALENLGTILDARSGAGFSFDPSIDSVKNLAEAAADAVNPLANIAGGIGQVGKSLYEGRGLVDSYYDGLASLLSPIEQGVSGLVDLTTENEALSESAKDAAAGMTDFGETVKDTSEAADQAAQEFEKFRRKFARSLLEIDDQAREDTDAAWEEYFDKEAEGWKDHQKRILDLKKRAAKDFAKIDRDLSKDLAKVSRDENRDIRRIQEDAAREQKQERRRKQIDAAADQRLFDFQLKQLAAEGQGNAILAALEQRRIEEQIAKDKAAVEAGIEDENQRVEIERVREAARERRRELQQQAAEEREARRQALAEALAEEQTAYEERRQELVRWREDKLDEIDASRQEAIKKLGQELAEMEDLSKEQLKQLKDTVGNAGIDIGKTLAEGINEGYATNLRVNALLGDDTPGSGAGGAGGRGGAGSVGRRNPATGGLWRFAEGGSFVVGGAGGVDSQLVQFMATPNETVTITPPGQASGGNSFTVNINHPVFGQNTSPDQVKAMILNGLQEFTDEILAPALR